jgi:hypothetical protein
MVGELEAECVEISKMLSKLIAARSAGYVNGDGNR